MERAVGFVASIIAIFAFITGVASVPQLISNVSDTSNRNSEILKDDIDDFEDDIDGSDTFLEKIIIQTPKYNYTTFDPSEVLADYKENPIATKTNYLNKKVKFQYNLINDDITLCPDIYSGNKLFGLLKKEELCLRSEFYIGDLSRSDYAPESLRMKNKAGVFCIFDTRDKEEIEKINTTIFNNLENEFYLYGDIVYIADSLIGGGWRFSVSNKFRNKTKNIGNMFDGFKGYFRVIILSNCEYTIN